MIHIERPAALALLNSIAFEREKKRMADYILNVKQGRYDYAVDLLHKLKPALQKAFNDKCAYCEASLSVTGYGDVVQYRPRSVYWWLTYEWDNQLISCQVCSQRYKGVSFPVANNVFFDDSLQNKSVKELNELEKPLLLNPFDDEPKEHLMYKMDMAQQMVTILPLTPRGETTITTLGLNRQELAEQRYQVAEVFNTFVMAAGETKDISIVKQIEGRIKQMLADSGQFAGMTRQLLHDYEKENGLLFPLDINLSDIERHTKGVRSIITESSAQPTVQPLPPQSAPGLIINKFIPCDIEISNFKSIGHLTLHFRGIEENMDYAQKKLRPGEDIETALRESWLLLLGENGVGKSSVLQAVALALLPDDLRHTYIEDPKDLVKIGTQEGYVKIKLGDKEPVEMTFNAEGEIKGNIHQYNDFLLAYGATRLLPKGSLQPEPNVSKIKVHNLFDYSIALENAMHWLLQLNEDDFDQAALFLKDILFLKQNLLRQNNNIYTQENDKREELEWLSDGHKTLLALSVDMLKTFATQESDSRYRDVQKYASGMVLIDEVGTHLHPRWKMKIVERLRTALPRVFFIVTSHEPLCMRGLRDKEVVVLKRNDETGEISAVADLPSPDGLRVDQLLTSKYFGLNSTVDPEVEDKFDQYYRLLGKPEIERTLDENKQITVLQAALKEYNQLGDNPREELFYYLVDEVIAKNIRQGGMKTKNELRVEVKDKIEALLKEIDINFL